MLDEPTAGLDPAERVRFRETLALLPGDRLVVLSTHIIADVEAIATEVALLDQGRLAWAGTPAGLLADAEGAVWTLTLAVSEFERLRGEHHVSAAIRRAETIEVRLVGQERPHASAVPASPTLEEAYLLFAGGSVGSETPVAAGATSVH